MRPYELPKSHDTHGRDIDNQKGFTHTRTHIQHSENDRSSCWRDLEVMLDHNTEEKNKFFNPGGCLSCELLDHMVIQGYECFPQCVCLSEK